MNEQEEPERLSCEWHALEGEMEAKVIELCIRSLHDPALTRVRLASIEEHRDRAAKLRSIPAKDARIAELEAEVTQHRKMMAEAEWYGTDPGGPCCPWCSGLQPGTKLPLGHIPENYTFGHFPTCPYAALNKETSDEG